MHRRDPLANPEPLIRRVYAYVAYRIGDGPDAEDVTSEVFERALRYRESYDPTRGRARRVADRYRAPQAEARTANDRASRRNRRTDCPWRSRDRLDRAPNADGRAHDCLTNAMLSLSRCATAPT